MSMYMCQRWNAAALQLAAWHRDAMRGDLRADSTLDSANNRAVYPTARHVVMPASASLQRLRSMQLAGGLPMMRHMVPRIIAALLTGCGVTRMNDAQVEYQQSSAAYKECLLANASAPQRCEGLRLAAEIDERKYTNFRSQITPGQRYDVNVMQR